MASPGLPVLLVGLCAISFAVEPRGIQPRTHRSDYFVTSFTESLAVAAELVNHDQVCRMFGNRTGRDYIVVEVGFYSKSHAAYGVRPGDFALRLKPTGAVLKPALVETEKILPEVVTSRAVGGYLFFPVAGSPIDRYELEYKGNGVWLSLPIRYGR